MLLPIERQMIHVLANDDRGDEPGRSDAALLQGLQWSDHWRGKRMILADIFRAHDPPLEEAAWLKVELLGDFLAHAAPVLRTCLHFPRHEDLLHYFGGRRDARLVRLTRR